MRTCFEESAQQCTVQGVSRPQLLLQRSTKPLLASSTGALWAEHSLPSPAHCNSNRSTLVDWPRANMSSHTPREPQKGQLLSHRPMEEHPLSSCTTIHEKHKQVPRAKRHEFSLNRIWPRPAGIASKALAFSKEANGQTRGEPDTGGLNVLMGTELGREHCGDAVRKRPYEAEKALGWELGTWCPSNSSYFCNRMESEWEHINELWSCFQPSQCTQRLLMKINNSHLSS